MIIYQTVQAVTVNNLEEVVKAEMDKGLYLHSSTVIEWYTELNINKAIRMLLIFHKEQ
jgi:hypothetical protein